MPAVLDIEQAIALLELEAPFEKRDVQLARRAHGQALAPGHRAARQAVRARAPPEGDQPGRRPARVARRGLARRARLAQRRQGQRRRGAPGPGRGGPPRLRGRAAPPRGGGRPREARPVRLARPRPLGRPPLRALRLLPGVGRRDGQRHLLHRRRRRRPAVGAREVRARRAHRPGRLAAVRRLLQARPGRRARPALHDRRPARDGRGRLQARRAAPRSTPATPSRTTRRCCAS